MQCPNSPIPIGLRPKYQQPANIMWKDCSRVQCATIEDRSTAQEEGFA
jgi:hypothetical protein